MYGSTTIQVEVNKQNFHQQNITAGRPSRNNFDNSKTHTISIFDLPDIVKLSFDSCIFQTLGQIFQQHRGTGIGNQFHQWYPTLQLPSPKECGTHHTKPIWQETSNAHDSICGQPVCIVSYKRGRKTCDASLCSQTFLSTSSRTRGCGHSRTVRLRCGRQQQNSYIQTTRPTMEDTRQYQCRVLEPSTIRLEKQSSLDFPIQLATIEPQDTDFRTSRQICGQGLLQSQMQSRHP